jgi:hypothetical protein
MRHLNRRAPRIAGLLALALGAVALLAVSGAAMAKDHGHDDNGGHHGRHHQHNHFREMHEAGTISAFDATTGRLTIALTDGGSVTGLVTEETQIRCEGFDDRLDHGGDNSGSGSSGSGGSSGGPDPSGGSNGSGSTPGGPGPSNGSGPGPNAGGDQPVEDEGPEEGPNCTTASLVPGAFVGEAELRLGTGKPVFEEIELGHDS